jgi:hypothetical protein
MPLKPPPATLLVRVLWLIGLWLAGVAAMGGAAVVISRILAALAAR